jgi:hypothetical protein
MARDPRRSKEFDADVRSFVERRLYSIEQLEIFILMHAQPTRFFDAAAVAQRLRLSESRVADDLEAICRRGLLDVRIASAVLYRFSPATPALALEADRVSDAYKQRRGDLVELLTSRRRQRSLKDFSDAFRLKGDPADG